MRLCQMGYISDQYFDDSPNLERLQIRSNYILLFLLSSKSYKFLSVEFGIQLERNFISIFSLWVLVFVRLFLDFIHHTSQSPVSQLLFIKRMQMSIRNNLNSAGCNYICAAFYRTTTDKSI